MPRSANSRSSQRSSSRGSKSQARERRLDRLGRALQRLHRLVQRLARSARSASGACGMRRCSRRAIADSTGRIAASPDRLCCASRMSAATFSPCIMRWRRSASASSSPGCDVELVSSSLAWRAKSAAASRRGDARALGGQLGLDVAQRGEGARASPRPAPRGRHRRRPARDGSRRRAARARRAGRGSRPGRRRARAASAR